MICQKLPPTDYRAAEKSSRTPCATSSRPKNNTFGVLRPLCASLFFFFCLKMTESQFPLLPMVTATRWRIFCDRKLKSIWKGSNPEDFLFRADGVRRRVVSAKFRRCLRIVWTPSSSPEEKYLETEVFKLPPQSKECFQEKNEEISLWIWRKT